MNSIWNKNLKKFKERFFPLFKILSESSPKLFTEEAPYSMESPPLFWQIQSAKNREPTAKSQGIFLHSAYNPTREAAAINQNEDIKKTSATVMLGLGLGYHLVQWAKSFSKTEKKLIVIEPDLEYFVAAMCFTDFSEVFEVKNLVLALACPLDQVIHLIEDSSKINIGDSGVSDAFVFQNNAFMSHNPQYFNTVKTIIQRNKRKNEINAATLKKFGKLWCKNSVKNLYALTEHPNISQFCKTDIPFLILGAGPTLNEFLDFLPLVKNKVITICAETALHALLKNNFEPDFILLTDPQYWAYRHIAGLHAEKSFLVTEVCAYPSVFRFKCREIILCTSQFPVGKFFEQNLKMNLGDLGTGGSVICSAWNLAEFLGAEKIFTAGVDLGFPLGQTHIKGSSAEQTYHTLSTKLQTAEKFTASAISTAAAQNAEDFEGNKIITDSRMKLFAWWLESRIAACPKVKTYTLSKKSMFIPGISVAEKDDVLKLPEQSKKKEEFLNSIYSKKISIKEQAELKEKFTELKNNFPNEEFLREYPFLREYL